MLRRCRRTDRSGKSGQRVSARDRSDIAVAVQDRDGVALACDQRQRGLEGGARRDAREARPHDLGDRGRTLWRAPQRVSPDASDRTAVRVDDEPGIGFAAAQAVPRLAQGEMRRERRQSAIRDPFDREHGRYVDVLYELSHVIGGRLQQDFLRRSDLDDLAVLHEHDPPAEADRFIEVVRDEHHGFSEIPLQLPKLLLHAAAN